MHAAGFSNTGCSLWHEFVGASYRCDPEKKLLRFVFHNKNYRRKMQKIKLIRMESEESKIHKNNTFYVDKTKGEIECYPIERKLYMQYGK